MIPAPELGLVVRYAYLWRSEARQGRDEGAKDRPCVVVLAVQAQAGRTIVTVAPITHTPPATSGSAVEIPAPTKARLGLDAERSWVKTDEVNRFFWPGPDLRPVPRKQESAFSYGILPADLYNKVREQLMDNARKRVVGVVPRS